jgi:hypothetical protein
VFLETDAVIALSYSGTASVPFQINWSKLRAAVENARDMMMAERL